MPYITFTQDVTLDSEPEGTGPHYRAGYSPDVPDGVARHWVSKGLAVFGRIEVAAGADEIIAEPIDASPEEVSLEEVSLEEELPSVPKRQTSKRWSPLDSE